MKKAELKAIVEKHNMKVLVNRSVDRVNVGLCLTTPEDIPELDMLAGSANLWSRVSVAKEYIPRSDKHTYHVICPGSWLDHPEGC